MLGSNERTPYPRCARISSVPGGPLPATTGIGSGTPTGVPTRRSPDLMEGRSTTRTPSSERGTVASRAASFRSEQIHRTNRANSCVVRMRGPQASEQLYRRWAEANRNAAVRTERALSVKSDTECADQKSTCSADRSNTLVIFL